MRAFEQSRCVWYLGYFDGATLYLPADCPEHRIREVVEGIGGQRADQPEIRLALYQLWLSTKHERMSEEDRDAKLMLYVQRLSIYPTEAVLAVIQSFENTADFFPSWKEVHDRLRPLLGWRSDLIDALRRVSFPATTEG